MSRTYYNFYKDWLFLLAIGAALVYWLALYLAVRPALEPGWPIREPWLFVYPALIYPVIEELVFRGFVQDLAHQRLKAWKLGPISHANLLTSVLFTALHFINHPPVWAAAVFIPSLIFGFFKDRSGCLPAPITLHIFYNSGYLWLFAPPP